MNVKYNRSNTTYKIILIVTSAYTLLLTPVADAVWTSDQYYVDGDGFHIVGVGPTNPIIYDNDAAWEVPDDEWIMAKASLGEANLVGWIATTAHPWCYYVGGFLQENIESWNRGQAAGMCMDRIPYPVEGSPSCLSRPGSGVIEDTAYPVSPGSTLIVQEANKRSAESPLVYTIGGAGETLAAAYLQDNSIADKVVVYFTDACCYNGANAWTRYILGNKFRMLNISRKWWWPTRPNRESWRYAPNPSEWSQLPVNAVTEHLIDMWLTCGYYTASGGYWDAYGDGFHMHMWDSRCIPDIQRTNINPDGGIYDTGDANCDILEVSSQGMAEQPIHDLGMGALGNPTAYDNICPSSLEPPSNVQVVSASLSGIELTWQDNSTEIQEDDFVIERNPYGGQDEWYEVGTASQNATSYTDSVDLHGMVVYTYRVGARKN